MRLWRKQGARRWRGWVGATLVFGCAALYGAAPIAAASSSDAQATHAYLLAQYRLVMALLHDVPAMEAAQFCEGYAEP